MTSQIGSGHGLVPSDNKQLPKPGLVKIHVAIWRHYTTVIYDFTFSASANSSHVTADNRHASVVSSFKDPRYICLVNSKIIVVLQFHSLGVMHYF